MKTILFNCDICGKDFPEKRTWTQEPQRLTIITHCYSQNPMQRITGKDFQSNTYIAEDVCPLCMERIAETIASKIEILRKGD